MRKTILTVLVVLLAVMAVTCDNFEANADKEPTQYTEDGRELIWLTINPKRSRALTAELAKNNVTYYEVAFKDQVTGTKIYRRAWNYTQTGRIAVPAGDYAGAGNAVLFAGRYSDKTLLAVGVITMVDSASSTTITPKTATVTFTLSPLTNDVSANPINVSAPPAPADLTASTFQITGPTPYETSTYTTANYMNFPKVAMESEEGRIYPLYQVPLNSAAITATYKINCSTGNLNYAGVMISGAGTLLSAPATNISYGVKVTGTVLPDAIASIPAAGTAVPTSGIFDITIDTTGITDGLSQISIEVPVCAINITNDYPGTWYIRGGLNQHVLDQGINVNTIGSLGGAVLLGVGEIIETGFIIIPLQ